jgi:DNA repair exonuclease SbcCD ATPase subunit
VLDNLDEASALKVVSFLKDYYPDKAIYVISHDQSLKSLFDSVVKVVKENGISRIEEEK